VEAESQRAVGGPKLTGVMSSACTSIFFWLILAGDWTWTLQSEQRLGHGLDFSKISIPPLDSTQTPRIRWVLTEVLCQWVKLTERAADHSSNLVPRLRMDAAMTQLSHMTLWLIQRQIYCHFCKWVPRLFY